MPVPQPVAVPVDRPVPVPHPVAVPVDRPVPVPYPVIKTHIVEKPIAVPVDRPYPVDRPVLVPKYLYLHFSLIYNCGVFLPKKSKSEFKHINLNQQLLLT